MNTQIQSKNTDCVTLEQFKMLLEHHDWFYHFSDDSRVWRSGERESSQLLQIAKDNSDDFKRLYNEFHAKCFNTPSFIWEGHPYTPPFNIQS